MTTTETTIESTKTTKTTKISITKNKLNPSGFAFKNADDAINKKLYYDIMAGKKVGKKQNRRK